MKKVLVAGTFDIFHLGHLCFLKEAKKEGDKLVVVIGNNKIKEKELVHTQKERAELIKNLKIVDEIVMGKSKIIESIKKVKPDIVCVGYDQLIPEEIEKYCKENKIKIKRIKKTYKPTKCKSSILRKKINNKER